MNNNLVIDVLRHIAELPNSFDHKVLLKIQENIACDVMKQQRNDLIRLLDEQRRDGVPPAEAEQQRKAFFAKHLNLEYQNRSGSGMGFNMPLYLETAENHYRLEIRRHLQQMQDYVAHGRAAAELCHVDSVRELRARDPGVADLSHKVAEGLNSINDSLEKLSRIRSHVAEKVTQELKQEMYQGFVAIQNDSFAASMLIEAQTLADVKRELTRYEQGSESKLAPR
ncbi:hypothetical protein [Chromobacterium haemolyticum]|uniref:hypothetical protein n=1 Tax=Chromobacterium haemolyticum TaxID=394935 RepID=UPI00244B1DEC|nr:hypothetical protein [Chromobacterium haemolyticum]MDH0342036.1 hypothetical protein [Chromobacterium haemolyticum]